MFSVADCTHILGADTASGLSSRAIADLQTKYGFNELTSKSGKIPFLRFLMGFNEPLSYILLAAGVVSLLLQDWVDAAVILAVAVLNALIGFFQESKAENEIAALAQSVITEATVICEGQKIRFNSRELVPGDLVLLTSGDKVPDDLRLVTSQDLQISEAP